MARCIKMVENRTALERK